MYAICQVFSIELFSSLKEVLFMGLTWCTVKYEFAIWDDVLGGSRREKSGEGSSKAKLKLWVQCKVLGKSRSIYRQSLFFKVYQHITQFNILLNLLPSTGCPFLLRTRHCNGIEQLYFFCTILWAYLVLTMKLLSEMYDCISGSINNPR